MKVVLFQPQIPQNTGNVVRTCSVTGTELVLVGPLGFSLSDRWLKRAGLDYWEGVSVTTIEDLKVWLTQKNAPFYFFSSKATTSYSSLSYERDDILIFGSETSGLPAQFFDIWPEKFATIPMRPQARCLNLATAVGIVVFEAARQQNFVF